MNYITAVYLINTTGYEVGTAMLAILSTVIVIGAGYLIFKFGLNLIWHIDGTTNWLGRHWNAWDHISYKRWRGYNRFHSAEWNVEHTM